jgi:methionine-rich copper-binding protein CopC
LRRILGVVLAASAVLAAPAAARVAESAVPARADATVTLSAVGVDANWKESWLTATLTFSGSVDAPASLTAFVKPANKPGNVAAKTTLSVPAAGAFTGQLRLPPRLLPGVYRLRVDPGDSAPVDADFKVPAPPEGVVDKAGVSTAKGGRLVDRLQGTTPVIWARFHFVVAPQTKTIEISWYTPSFRFIGKVKRQYKPTVDTFLRNTTGRLQPGVWYAIAKVGGVVVKRTRLRIV